MLTVYVNLKVKFRAFGVTFGTVSQSWTIPIQHVKIEPLTYKEVLRFSERGVELRVAIDAVQPNG